MVFKVALDGQVVSCSSVECIKWLLLQGWKLADPAQWDDLKDALLSEAGLTVSSESGTLHSRVQSPGLPRDSAHDRASSRDRRSQ
jgi:hypothetical protein